MVRLALIYVRPGMVLGRDIVGPDGQVILAAGVRLNEKYIDLLQHWDVGSVYLDCPRLELPAAEEVITPQLRARLAKAVKTAFADVAAHGLFELSAEQREVVDSVVRQVLRDRAAMLSLAQISRHQQDLFTHSVNVAVLSLMTAVALEIRDGRELHALTVGALLHDIGKVFVPPHILAKRQPLSEEETELMKAHALSGFEVLSTVPGCPPAAAQIAWQHHENFDGSGYPRGLAGQDILLFGRIVAIADAYDAMIAGRPWQKAIEAHAAYERILSAITGRFDPQVAKVFLAKIAVYPVGTMVRLTTGQTGVVARVTSLLQHRPEIRVLADDSGRQYSEPYVIDLADKDNLTVFIDRVLSEREKAALLGPEADSR